MAKRLYFKSVPDQKQVLDEKLCAFQYFNGFAVSQKQKCIAEFHKQIRECEPDAEIIEISTKSTSLIGVALSAFNLMFYDRVREQEFALENIFQSSKVFENGGPYEDILLLQPRDAKRDERLKSSGQLQYFLYQNVKWDLEPKTLFYDWIYMSALKQNEELAQEVIKYTIFTDIEFNQEKSINCQARSAAIFASLSKLNILEKALSDPLFLSTIYKSQPIGKQTSLF